MTGDQKKRIAEQLDQLGFDKHWAVDLPTVVNKERYKQALQQMECTAVQASSASL